MISFLLIKPNIFSVSQLPVLSIYLHIFAWKLIPSTRATKSQVSPFFCLFQSLSNVHKPNFALIPWAIQKLLGQKEYKFVARSKFSCSTFFSLSIFCWSYNNRYWCFCKFSCNCNILMDFCHFWRNNIIFPVIGRLNNKVGWSRRGKARNVVLQHLVL